MSTVQTRKVSAARKLIPVHIAPRVPGLSTFNAQTPVTLCGEGRTHETKVVQAAGIATCPKCKELYRARINGVRDRGQRMFAGTQSRAK